MRVMEIWKYLDWFQMFNTESRIQNKLRHTPKYGEFIYNIRENSHLDQWALLWVEQVMNHSDQWLMGEIWVVPPYYSDVITRAMASQITSPMIVYTSVYSGADQRNIKAPLHWPLWVEFTGDWWIPRTNGQ